MVRFRREARILTGIEGVRPILDPWAIRNRSFRHAQDLVGYSGAPEVEINFDIPDESEWVTELSGTPVRYWELVVESARPGIDFRTTFPLPVYRRN